MKRSLALLAVSALFIGFFQSPASGGSVVAKGKCSKLGLTAVSAGKKFTCIKSRSRLVWNQGVAIAKTPTPTPTPSPTPSPTPKAFKAQIPITLPVAQNGTITFSNLDSRIGDIGQVAWQRVQETLKSNLAPQPINNDVHVGPNTTININGGLPRIQELLTRAQKVFSGFTQVSNFTLLMYNAKDEPWAEAEWNTLATARKYFAGQILGQKRTIAGNCQQTISPGVFSGAITDCNGADSGAIQGRDDSILTFGVSNTPNPQDPNFYKGGVVGHEYVHSVQAAQWIGNPKVYCTEQTNSPDCFRSHWVNNTLPCWFNEGSGNALGYTIVSDTFADYLEFRKYIPFNQGPTTVTDYSEASLRDFLFNQVIGDDGCISSGPIYRLGYTVGALAVETLVAIGGPQSVMAVYALCAEGSNFPTAFAKVYGLSWEEASRIIAKAVAAEYATFGPPPK